MVIISSTYFFDIGYIGMGYSWAVSNNNPVETNPAGEHGANGTERYRFKIG